MEINLRRLNQSVYHLVIQPGDTVLQKKQQLCEKQGIPTAMQRMIYEGRILQDDEVAGTLLMQPGVIILLLIKKWSENQWC